MKQSTSDSRKRDGSGLEDNLKKALTELLLLFLFSEGEHYIGELAQLLEKHSGGTLTVVFPYAAIYRMTQAGYLKETKKKNAPDGRFRQYYAITKAGRNYLQELMSTYRIFFEGVEAVLSGGEKDEQS